MKKRGFNKRDTKDFYSNSWQFESLHFSEELKNKRPGFHLKNIVNR